MCRWWESGVAAARNFAVLLKSGQDFAAPVGLLAGGEGVVDGGLTDQALCAKNEGEN